MTETTPSKETTCPQHDNPRSTRRRKLFFLGLAGAAATLFAPLAFAHRRRGGWHHLGDAELRERMAKHLAWALDRLGVDDTQRAEIEAIADPLAGDLLALRREGKAVHESLHTAVQADVLDGDALEALRVKAIELADRVSSRVLAALLQASAVLTAEQRAELHRHLRRRHMAPWH